MEASNTPGATPPGVEAIDRLAASVPAGTLNESPSALETPAPQAGHPGVTAAQVVNIGSLQAARAKGFGPVEPSDAMDATPPAAVDFARLNEKPQSETGELTGQESAIVDSLVSEADSFEMKALLEEFRAFCGRDGTAALAGTDLATKFAAFQASLHAEGRTAPVLTLAEAIGASIQKALAPQPAPKPAPKPADGTQQALAAELQQRERANGFGGQPPQSQGKVSVLHYLLSAFGRKFSRAKPVAPTLVPAATLEQWLAARSNAEKRLSSLAESVAAVAALPDGATDAVAVDARKRLAESADAVTRGFQNDAQDLLKQVNGGALDPEAVREELEERKQKIDEVMRKAIDSDEVDKKPGIKAYLGEMQGKMQGALAAMIEHVVRTIERLLGAQKSAGPKPG